MKTAIIYWFITTLICIGMSSKEEHSKKETITVISASAVLGWIIVPIEIGVLIDKYHEKNFGYDKH